eukprot:Pgem_evm1s16651
MEMLLKNGYWLSSKNMASSLSFLAFFGNLKLETRSKQKIGKDKITFIKRVSVLCLKLSHCLVEESDVVLQSRGVENLKNCISFLMDDSSFTL